MTFKQRVYREIISGVTIYKNVFVDYEYLIYCSLFKNKHYYIIKAEEDNYPHLTGVNPLISAQDFYNRCLDGTLQETDFNFFNKHKSEKEIIGSVRRKIKLLPLLSDFFLGELHAEENFNKGSVYCSLATADNILTIGFVNNTELRPKTLLKNNELNSINAVEVSLILRRDKGAEKFNNIVQGDVMEFRKVYPDILDCDL